MRDRFTSNDDVHGGVIAFFITWCICGLIGLVPWNHPGWNGGTGKNWHWHMDSGSAWFVWALIVTLAAMAAGFIAYAIKRWH